MKNIGFSILSTNEGVSILAILFGLFAYGVYYLVTNFKTTMNKTMKTMRLRQIIKVSSIIMLVILVLVLLISIVVLLFVDLDQLT